jgi:hypothetical protein
LEKAVSEIGGVGLITIDPITAYMGGKIDSHKVTEVRNQLGPLKDFAEQTGVAISTVTHPPKAGGPRAIDQYIGSQAFIAAGRIGHICIEEYEVDEKTGEKKLTGRVLFANPKSNPSKKMPTLAFHIEQAFVGEDHINHNAIYAPYVIWDGVVNVTADEALALIDAKPKAQLTDQQELQKLLCKILADGPVDYKLIVTATEDFSIKQLKLAKEKLGIQWTQTGLGRGEVFWSLPRKMSEET